LSEQLEELRHHRFDRTSDSAGLRSTLHPVPPPAPPPEEPADPAERERTARGLELAISSSVGFWTTIGLLAIWSLRRGHGGEG